MTGTAHDAHALPRRAGRYELMFGLVRASGTKLDLFETTFHRVWEDFGFDFNSLRLADLAFAHQPLYEELGALLPPDDSGQPGYKKYFRDFPSWVDRRDALNRGVRARKLTLANDIVLRDALKALESHRQQGRAQGDTVWSLRSLMHPSEVNLLRDIYGGRYFTIGVYEPYIDRLTNIEHILRTELPQAKPGQVRRAAEYLLALDTTAVKIPATFEKSDLFVDLSRPNSMHFAVHRFVSYVLGYPFAVPTVDEFGMALAWTARRSSSALARTVGAAALAPNSSSVLAVGCNDIPRSPRVGPWPDNDVRIKRASREPAGDYREHLLGRDASDKWRREVFADLIRRLQDVGVIDKSLSADAIYNRRGVSDALQVSDARQFDAIEYSRTIHAEAALIADAASRGVSLYDATLYVTTFPCHECSRLIVQSGISRVVFVEPYAKSLALALYERQIYYTDSPEQRRRRALPLQVLYEPFVGIAPGRFSDLFSFEPRKETDRGGSQRTLDGQPSRWPPATGYAPRESIVSPFLAHSAALLAMHELERLAIAQGEHKWAEMLEREPGIRDALGRLT